MLTYDSKKILSGLEYSIKETSLRQPKSMFGDRWLVSSCLQKSIRRGDKKHALAATVALWNLDRQNFWRRLHIAALEDVGVGSPDVVVQVLAATSSLDWRRRVGDLRVGLFLTSLLCEAVKSRAADELFLCIERSSEHAHLRKYFAKADNSLLAAYASDVEEPLTKRALALWFLAGTTKYTSDLLPPRKGSLEEAIKVLRSLEAPADLVESCISVASRTQWPLGIFTPLIWQEIQKSQSVIGVRHDDIPVSDDVEGIPLFGVDQFTRIGQTCLRHFQKAVPELAQFNTKQIGLGIFYSEGGKLDKAVTSPFLEELRETGESADMENVGLDVPEYLGLKDCITRHASVLDDIRRQQVERYLNGGEE